MYTLSLVCAVFTRAFFHSCAFSKSNIYLIAMAERPKLPLNLYWFDWCIFWLVHILLGPPQKKHKPRTRCTWSQNWFQSISYKELSLILQRIQSLTYHAHSTRCIPKLLVSVQTTYHIHQAANFYSNLTNKIILSSWSTLILRP